MRFWIVVAALWMGLVVSTDKVWGQSAPVVLHVNRLHAQASDHNPGTLNQPLQTIQEAARRAVANKQERKGTRVVVHPGVYRESVWLGTYTNGQQEEPSSPMVFEASEPGTVIISGSEVWDNWQRQEKGLYLHTWPFDWKGGKEVINRREMVFVDGQLKTQVMAREKLGHSAQHLRGQGSYYVDDQEKKIYLQLASDDRLKETVEVGVRPTLWDQRGEDHVTIRGFVFEHAATAWSGGQAAVRIIDSENVLIENCSFRWNNWQGLYVGDSENVTVRRSRLNYNGGQGWNVWHVKNFLAEHTETSYNNWRGALGEHYGWNVGNKLMSAHGLTVRFHRAVGNLSRGLWLDYDISHAVIDDVVVQDNRLDGIWLEASQGPIVLKNSLIRGNGRSGLRTTYTENVVVENNIFIQNAEGPEVLLNDSQVIIDGGGKREVQNFETGERLQPVVRNWTFRGNTFVGGRFQHPHASGPTLIDTDLKKKDWQKFIRTLKASHNTYYHPLHAAVFGYPSYNNLTLREWQQRTGQDQGSVFQQPTEVVKMYHIRFADR